MHGLSSLLVDSEAVDMDKFGNVDVFNNFGYGTIGYFALIWSLIKVFALMSLMLVPTIVIYYQGGAFVGKVQPELLDLVRPTLGNIGHLAPVCNHHYIASKSHSNVHLECPTGKIK